MAYQGSYSVEHYRDRYGVAFGAGVMGAFLMSVIMGLARAMNWSEMNFEMSLGSMVTSNFTGGAWTLGFFWHLLNGGIFALIYNFAFQRTGIPDARRGAFFGLVHWIFAGIYLGLLPAVHPMIPEQMASPGFFGVGMGFGNVLFNIALHLMYGSIVGGVIGKSVRSAAIASTEDVEQRAA